LWRLEGLPILYFSQGGGICSSCIGRCLLLRDFRTNSTPTRNRALFLTYHWRTIAFTFRNRPIADPRSTPCTKTGLTWFRTSRAIRTPFSYRDLCVPQVHCFRFRSLKRRLRHRDLFCGGWHASLMFASTQWSLGACWAIHARHSPSVLWTPTHLPSASPSSSSVTSHTSHMNALS
jgi:hypothetical protein